MSGFVKVHTVNNVTLRDTAGLRRETRKRESERDEVGVLGSVSSLS